MWKSTSTQHNSELLNTSLSQSLKATLQAAVLPLDISTPNENAAAATSDASRAENIATGSFETLEVTPWQDGQPSRNKYSMSFYLSPTDAIEKLAKKLESSGWQETIVIAAMADNEAALHQSLQNIDKAFPLAEVKKAIRNAEHIANNEAQKRFLAKLPENPAVKTLSQIDFYKSESPALLSLLPILTLLNLLIINLAPV